MVRRNYVLRRMFELGDIEEAEYDEARNAPVTAKIHGLTVEVEAPYVAEMVRAHMEATYVADAYTAGYEVYTTLDGRLQHTANAALRQTLMEYDARHGYRGPERRFAPGEGARSLEETLAEIPTVGGLLPALVTSVGERVVAAHAKGAGPIEIPFESMEWVRPYIDEDRRGRKPESAAAVVQAGDVIRVRLTENGWHFSQLPEVEGALVSLDPNDGAIVALTGGFDFYRSKFNRVTQAERQPGSSFKPFIYSAALEHGYTPRQHHQRCAGGLRGSEPQECVAARELRREVLRAYTPAGGAVQVAQPRLDPAPARHRHRLRARPHRQVRDRRAAPAAESFARARAAVS